jgi:hypothetical protein
MLNVPGAGRRRRLTAGIAVGVVGSIALFLGAVLVVHLVAPGLGPVLATNRSGYALLRSRLMPVEDELNAVSTPVGARAGYVAKFEGCTTDSGEAFEPAVTRTWRLKDAAHQWTFVPSEQSRRVVSEIAAQLRARRWSGPKALADDGSASLTSRRNGYTVFLNIAYYDGTVIATAQSDPDHVCGHLF